MGFTLTVKLTQDYKKRTVDLSIPGHIRPALNKYQHLRPKISQHAPHKYNFPQYVVKVQMVSDKYHSQLLTPDSINLLQKIMERLIFYEGAVDSRILFALGTLVVSQAKGVKNHKVIEPST